MGKKKTTSSKRAGPGMDAGAAPSSAPSAGPAGMPGMPQPAMMPPGYPYMPPGMPQAAPGMPQGMPGYGFPPGYGPPPGYPPMPQPPQGGEGAPPAPAPMMPYGFPMPYGNPMAQMLQMYMGLQGSGAQVDASARPFVQDESQEAGLEADIVEPALIEDLTRVQLALPVHDLLDRLCLGPDGKTALGGLPQGCTIAFAGPPGRGKTRAMLEGVARAAAAGRRCAYVVAEEGFRDADNPGRDDLCSRLAKIAMAVTGLDEAGIKEQVLPNLRVILSQYHKGHTWEDFIRRYKYVVEDEEVELVVVDSLNTLDPSHARTSENLSVLKTYNHEHGVTCVTIGQIKDTGEPVGGEALMHTADAVFLMEELSLGSKEMAAFWGGEYRERITVLRARKCVTTAVFPHPVRVDIDASGRLVVHPRHPASLALPPLPARS